MTEQSAYTFSYFMDWMSVRMKMNKKIRVLQFGNALISVYD